MLEAYSKCLREDIGVEGDVEENVSQAYVAVSGENSRESNKEELPQLLGCRGGQSLK